MKYQVLAQKGSYLAIGAIVAMMTMLGASFSEAASELGANASHGNQRVTYTGAVFKRDTSIPALGEAYMDPSGLIWGDVVMGPDTENPTKRTVRLMNQWEAIDYCRAGGARLPYESDYEKLARYLGRGTAHGYSPFAKGGRAEVLPGLSSEWFWSIRNMQFGDQFIFDGYDGGGKWVSPSTTGVAVRCVSRTKISQAGIAIQKSNADRKAQASSESSPTSEAKGKRNLEAESIAAYTYIRKQVIRSLSEPMLRAVAPFFAGMVLSNTGDKIYNASVRASPAYRRYSQFFYKYFLGRIDNTTALRIVVQQNELGVQVEHDLYKMLVSEFGEAEASNVARRIISAYERGFVFPRETHFLSRWSARARYSWGAHALAESITSGTLARGSARLVMETLNLIGGAVIWGSSALFIYDLLKSASANAEELDYYDNNPIAFAIEVGPGVVKQFLQHDVKESNRKLQRALIMAARRLKAAAGEQETTSQTASEAQDAAGQEPAPVSP